VANNVANTNNVATNNSNNTTSMPPMGSALAASADFATSASSWHRADLGPLTADDNSFGAGDIGIALGPNWGFVLDRDNSQVQVLDFAAGNDDAGIVDVSGAAATNPHDATDAGGNAYISLYDAGEIAVATPNGADWDQSRISLSQFDTFDDNPEPSAMLTDGALVLVVLQQLQDFVGVEPSQLLVIDSSDDSFVGAPIDLGVTNAQAGLRTVGDNYAVGVTGDFGANDGGILQITRNGEGDYVVGEMLVTEDDLGGDLLDFVFTSDTAGYAVITLPDFSSQLLSFTTGANVDVVVVSAVTAPGFGGLDFRDGWLAVGERDPGAMAFMLFDLADPSLETSFSIPSTLPPSGFVFLP
jgi:hypothetical protein